MKTMGFYIRLSIPVFTTDQYAFFICYAVFLYEMFDFLSLHGGGSLSLTKITENI